jgi:hypothetical protein
VGLTTLDVLDRWSRLEEDVDRCVPLLQEMIYGFCFSNANNSSRTM